MAAADPGESTRVVVVTGGGGGIGAAVAEQLGRDGAFVVTMDPLVTLDGSEVLPAPEETTAGRIVAGGGAARASSTSVTDGDAVRDLFAGLVDEFGRLDAVVNVAGITRPTAFASGREEDWAGVLSVHLEGYLNVLRAALPLMAAAGHGRILGVTSGSGWRAADAGAYGCAKRAVAALTWQLGRHAPPGVVVNAMSPIAVTRMVTAALGRVRAGTQGSTSEAAPGGASSGSPRSATGGLSLGSMPQPGQLGPFGAYLVGEAASWCRGRVLFAGGSEVALIDEPRLIEVVRTDHVASLPDVLEAVTTGALVPAETHQTTGGATNPRFGAIFDTPATGSPSGPRASVPPAACAVVGDDPALTAAVTAALESRGVTCTTLSAAGTADAAFAASDAAFAAGAAALSSATDQTGALGAVVAVAAPRTGGSVSGGAAPASRWEQILAEHDGVADAIRADAAWARAVSDLAAREDRPIRLVTLVDATSAGGRSRAQAATQLSRAARGASGGRVTAVAVALESRRAGDIGAIGQLAAHLVCSEAAAELSGAELVAGAGWVGLRSHPRPAGSITFGGPDLPDWFDAALRGIVGVDEVAGDQPHLPGSTGS